MNKVSLAITFATKAHDGQLDKIGLPYILHPLRVGAMGKTENEMIVGFLHDTLEDTDLSPDIIKVEFGTEVYEAVLSVTREPWAAFGGTDWETYMDFVKRAGANPIGRQVKLNDLKDNTSFARMMVLSEADQARLMPKYEEAMEYLENL